MAGWRICRGGAGVALLAWAANFTALYALATYACERRALGWLATGACAAVVLVILIGAARSRPESNRNHGTVDGRGFARPVTVVIAGLALIAIAWQAFAVLGLPGCRP
jgi:hypothetical protein